MLVKFVQYSLMVVFLQEAFLLSASACGDPLMQKLSHQGGFCYYYNGCNTHDMAASLSYFKLFFWSNAVFCTAEDERLARAAFWDAQTEFAPKLVMGILITSLFWGFLGIGGLLVLACVRRLRR